MGKLMTPANNFLRGIKASLPIMFGFIPFALVLGAQAAQKGMQYYELGTMTGLNFAGGSEFTAVSLWTHPTNITLIVAMSVLVNCRHLIMGATLSLYMKAIPRLKALGLLFFMCDEVWALSLSEAQKSKRKQIDVRYYMGTAVTLYSAWLIFTTLGAYLGPILGDIERYGFDMAFIAIFMYMLKGMWKTFALARPWFVSLITAGAVHHLAEGAWYVPAGALSGILSAYFWAKHKGKG